MKKINGNAPVVQLVIFLITLVYFLVFSQNYIRAEAARCAKEYYGDIQKTENVEREKQASDIQEIRLNLKNLCNALGVTYIEK